MPLDTTEIVALIGLSGVASTVLATWMASSRSIYVNSITVERNKWIDKLRTNIAACVTEIRVTAMKVGFDRKAVEAWEEQYEYSDDFDAVPPKPGIKREDILGHFERLQTLSNIIKLQLNPRNVIDQNIINILNSGSTNNLRDGRKLGITARLLVDHSQWLLKSEWEKVKYEGGSILYRYAHKGDDAARLAEYAKWAKTYGSITPLLRHSDETAPSD